MERLWREGHQGRDAEEDTSGEEANTVSDAAEACYSDISGGETLDYMDIFSSTSSEESEDEEGGDEEEGATYATLTPVSGPPSGDKPAKSDAEYLAELKAAADYCRRVMLGQDDDLNNNKL